MTFPDLTKVMVGPDVSNNNDPLNATALAAQRMSFVIYKVSQGLITGAPHFLPSGLDVQARANEIAAREANCLVARYHFLERGDGAAQARRFHQLSEGMGKFNFSGHCVDVELQSQDPRIGPTLQDCIDFLVEWRRLTAASLGIYSAAWYWAGDLKDPELPAFDWLWDGGTYVSETNSGADPWQVLQSGGTDKQGVTPGHWNKFGGQSHYDLRQFFDRCSIGGISPCDVSVFPGVTVDLAKLWGVDPSPVGVARPTPPTPEPVPMQTPIGKVSAVLLFQDSTGIYFLTGDGTVHVPVMEDVAALKAAGVPYVSVTDAFGSSLRGGRK
jgi:hypothetical protein